MSMPTWGPLPTMFPRNKWITAKDVEILRANFMSPSGDRLGSGGAHQFWLLDHIVTAFGAVRRAAGVPIVITSGHRSHELQKILYAQRSHNGAVAFPGTSPHEFGAALDMAVPRGFTQDSFARLIIQTLRGDVRVGWKSYRGQGFVHMDVCQKLIGPDGRPPHPAHVAGVTW